EGMVAERTGIAAGAATAQAEEAANMPALRKDEAEAAARVQHLTIAREKLDEELARLARQREAAEMRLAQIQDDLTRETARIADAGDALTRIGAEQERLKAESDAEAGDRERTREALMAAAKAVEAVEEELAR